MISVDKQRVSKPEQEIYFREQYYFRDNILMGRYLII